MTKKKTEMNAAELARYHADLRKKKIATRAKRNSETKQPCQSWGLTWDVLLRGRQFEDIALRKEKAA